MTIGRANMSNQVSKAPMKKPTNSGLAKLPKAVRNKMGYMAYGGKVKKMKNGGSCRGMGKASRGGKYKVG